MPAKPDDIGARIWWALERHRWIALAVLVLFVTGGWIKGSASAQPRYEAATLVVATDLGIRADQLPRFAETVFRGGRVARTTAQDTSTSIAPEDLIPEHVRLEPLEDNVLLRVVGADHDPDEAARLSHAAAVALATELNRAGPGVGSFTIQEPAQVPTRAIPTLGRLLPVGITGAAGLLFVLASASLLLVVRRPVTTAQQASSLTKLPVLGTPVLRRHQVPVRVQGLGALLHQLFPAGDERVLFLAVRGGGGPAARLVGLVIKALLRAGRVGYVPADDDEDPLGVRRDPAVIVAESDGVVRADPNMPLVVDAGSVDDADVQQLLDLLPAGVRAALIIPEGTPEWRAIAAASQLSRHAEAGIVFLPRSPRRIALPSRPRALMSGPTDGAAAETADEAERPDITATAGRQPSPITAAATSAATSAADDPLEDDVQYVAVDR